jgi:hypothetical protein
VPERRHLREQRRLDVRATGVASAEPVESGGVGFAGAGAGTDEELDRLQARRGRGGDQVLALAREQAEPVALRARLQPPQQPQLRVVAGRDHAAQA